jgi:hypothetical protein
MIYVTKEISISEIILKDKRRKMDLDNSYYSKREDKLTSTRSLDTIHNSATKKSMFKMLTIKWPLTKRKGLLWTRIRPPPKLYHKHLLKLFEILIVRNSS